jgi:hypothetical protein
MPVVEKEIVKQAAADQRPDVHVFKASAHTETQPGDIEAVLKNGDSAVLGIVPAFREFGVGGNRGGNFPKEFLVL